MNGSNVAHGMQEKFGLTVEKECWVELDSSTETKFSRHLVLHTADFCFKSNLHVGCFVEEMLSRAKQAESDEASSLFLPKVLFS